MHYVVASHLVACRCWGTPAAAESCSLSGAGSPLQELGIYGKLRKVHNCGPVSMFRALLVEWKVSADTIFFSTVAIPTIATVVGLKLLASKLQPQFLLSLTAALWHTVCLPDRQCVLRLSNWQFSDSAVHQPGLTALLPFGMVGQQP